MAFCSWCGDLGAHVRRSDKWGDPIFLCDECARVDAEEHSDSRRIIRHGSKTSLLPGRSEPPPGSFSEVRT